MNGIHTGSDWDVQLAEMQQTLADRGAEIESICSEIASSVEAMFDEKCGQQATLTSLLNEFELDLQRGDGGFAAFLKRQEASQRFVDESAFGWAEPKRLSSAARAAWREAARPLQSSNTTRFGSRWAAEYVPKHPVSDAVSDAVLADADVFARLFDKDFDSAGTAVLRALQSALGANIGLRHRRRWQDDYWLKEFVPSTAPSPTQATSWGAVFMAWLRRLFGGGNGEAFDAPEFAHGEVKLDVLPKPVRMQAALWRNHETRCAEAAALAHDVAEWCEAFNANLDALKAASERHNKAKEEIPRKVTAQETSDVMRAANDLLRDLWDFLK